MPRPSSLHLPHLNTLRFGYQRADVLRRVVDCLIVHSLSVHDFGCCPERTTPPRYQDTHFKSVVVQEKDMPKLLVAMYPFRNLTHLKLRGVLCPSTPFEYFILPLKYLFEGLSSPYFLKSHPEFMLALVDVTLVCGTRVLRNLTELSTTCEEYALVKEYLTRRSARGLLRLRLLTRRYRYCGIFMGSTRKRCRCRGGIVWLVRRILRPHCIPVGGSQREILGFRYCRVYSSIFL